MQPDNYTFLQSARREMLLAAKELGSNIRGVYLTRGAHVLERLAFYDRGLESLLPEFINRQQQLIQDIQSNLFASSVFSSPITEPMSRQAYEYNNLHIESLLHELAMEPRMQQPEKLVIVDRLFKEASQISYDLMCRIDTEAQTQARQWQAQRSNLTVIDVTPGRLTDYLRKRFPEYPELKVVDVEKLTGMNANEAFFLRIEGHPDWPEDAILRRSLPVQIQPTPITHEFAILENMVDRGVPIPAPLFCEDDLSVLGQPFLVLERLQGEVLPLPEMGERGKAVFLQLAELMGKLHSLDPGLLPEYRRANNGDNHGWLHERIGMYQREWLRGAREPVQTVTAAFHWLRRNSATFLGEQVIVHGDLDHRNMLIDADDKILALIDWEVCHQGHPAEDLAYVREHVEHVLPWHEFMAVYEENGGKRVTEAEMRYAKVLSNMLRVTTSMIAHDVYVDGAVDNFLMGTVRTLETETACKYLHEAIHGEAVSDQDNQG